MRILIIGGSGVIGSILSKRFFDSGNDVYYTFLTKEHNRRGCIGLKLDITNRQKTINLIKKVKPDVTIHTAALTNMDLCETYPKLANRINVEGTRNVVDSCKSVDSEVVYISTSNVFGDDKNFFSEDDIPKPINYYGTTKLQGERITIRSKLPFVIIRTDQPYGWIEHWQKRNFVINILERLEANQPVKNIFSDWYNRPTFLENFFEATNLLIEKEKIGVYHVVGSDFINRFNWALKIAEIWEKDKFLIEAKKSNILNLPAKRSNANLSNMKVQKEISVKLVGVEKGLRMMQKQSKSRIFHKN